MTIARRPKREFTLTVNGERKHVCAYPMERLLDVLRNHLNLTGTKEGCGEGECGACSVLVDGVLVDSCLVPVAQVANTSVLTIEGVSSNPLYRPLLDAFVECGGAQCGICTPGMIVAAIYLLDRNIRATTDEIREALAGNLCRCTGYAQIIEAVAEAARHTVDS
jgi:carbon-monoxide dehydrogenase small subunit